MSTTLNPAILGQAENAHRALLKRNLAGTGITYHQWVTLKVTAVSGRGIERDQLADRISGALKIDGTVAAATIAELTTSDLLAEEGARVGFTHTGQALYDRLDTAASEAIARLYRDLPADDLATAGRVLSIITARANAELS